MSFWFQMNIPLTGIAVERVRVVGQLGALYTCEFTRLFIQKIKILATH